jgi:hypothetical protein
MRLLVDGQYVFVGKYRGVVTNKQDPLKQGRIKARVPGVTNDVETPWALPSLPSNELKLPAINSMVWIEFEHGDPSRPIWTGYIPSSATGDQPLPDLVRGVPDSSVFAPRGTATVELGSGRTLKEMPSAFAGEYGENSGVTTPGGIRIERDDTAGQERIAVYHPAGTSVEIVSDGGVRVRAAKYNEVIRRDKTIHIMGKEFKAVEDVSEVMYAKQRKETYNGDFLERKVKGKLIEEFNGSVVKRKIRGRLYEEIGSGVNRNIGGTKRENIIGGLQQGVTGPVQVIALETSSEIIGNTSFGVFAKQVIAMFGTILIESTLGILQLSGLIVRLGGLFAFEPLVKGLSFAALYNSHVHTTDSGPTSVPVIPMIPGLHTSIKVFTE